jgi:hypothetical protein
MHLLASVIFVLVGTGCVAYVAAGAAVLERERLERARRVRR